MRGLALALLLVLSAASAHAAGSALPSGYLSVSGNQIVSGSGQNVRLACVGYNEPTGNYSSDMAIIRNAGFNCARYPYYDATLSLTTMDAIVSAATANNIRMIFDHHGNEGVDGNNGCLSQQSNGLWYDKNSAAPYNTTDGTDGCGTTGTITYATYKANIVSIATRYAGNPTVIALDLHNEPITYGLGGTNTNWAGHGLVNVAPGGGSDILAMFNDVGAAIHSANPGILLICEGPINNGPYLDDAGDTAPLVGDLTMAHTNPVTAAPGKVVYSVHDYPSDIGGAATDSGTAVTAIRNRAWGFLVSNNYAPVWVGEMGADMDNTNGNLADEQGWANSIVQYLNGLTGANGGPTFSGTQQGIGSDWWTFGNLSGQQLDGILNADGSLRAGQQAVYSQLAYYPTGSALSTWNPSDASAGITLSGNNETATSTATGGAGVRSTSSKASGKACVQVMLATATNNNAVGISTSAEVLTGYLGGSGSLGVGLYADYGGQPIYSNATSVGGTATPANSHSGDVVTIALDATAQKVWFSDGAMVTAGAPWDNSTTDNPATGTGGISISSLSPPYFLEANTQDSGTVFVANFTPSSGCPSGFPTWDTAVASSGGPITVILGQARSFPHSSLIRNVRFSPAVH